MAEPSTTQTPTKKAARHSALATSVWAICALACDDGSLVATRPMAVGHDAGQTDVTHAINQTDVTHAIKPRSRAVTAQEAYFKASVPGALDHFGYPVALSGNTLVVGARDADRAGSDGGAVYVFVHDGARWGQQATLPTSIWGAGDDFGAAIAITGATLAVGVPGDSQGCWFDCGSVRLFTRNGTQWKEQAVIRPFESKHGAVFGTAVAVTAGTLAVGAPAESNNGAAYVFSLVDGHWYQSVRLVTAAPGWAHEFGQAVALSGDTLVVGSPGEDTAVPPSGRAPSNGWKGGGAVYVFVRKAATWIPQAHLKASNAGFSDDFGRSVSIAGDTLVVGAYHEDGGGAGVGADETDNSQPQAGAVYVFVRKAGVWSQQAYLKADTPHEFDEFGASVAIDGDSLVVGAPREGSGGSGINGTVPAQGKHGSGAAYQFHRTGTTWSQEAHLKAAYPDPLDMFGRSVARSGAFVAVGAWGESSAAAGVGGDQEDNSMSQSGAAYVFR